MLTSIKLTGHHSGRPVFVDVQGICAIEAEKDGTSHLHFHGKDKTINVKEDPITVISSIQAFFAPKPDASGKENSNGQGSASSGSSAA